MPNVMSHSLPRPLVRAGLVLAAVALSATALAGCSSGATQATDKPTCGGKIAVVLLGDDSARDVVTFDAADSPKIFNLPTAPAPTCAYRSSTTSQTNKTTTTHRSYLYIGISDADAKKIIAALGATAGQAPWTGGYADVPAAGSTPAPYQLQTQYWNYNQGGTAGNDHGDMGYAYNVPINPGTAAQVPLSGDPNVLRIETEITSPSQ
jgi:hypothetical protein